MKKTARLIVCIVLLVMLFSSAYAAGFVQDGDRIEEAAKSVLQIAGFNRSDPNTSTWGSGFIAFNSSTLITNYHVIDDLSGLYAWDDDDKEYEIKYILCADKEADIAILEFANPTGLKPLELYPDDQLKRGSPVLTIGSPDGGRKNTTTDGIISSYYTNDKGYPEIQFSAFIYHGSSGGALFNDNGQVIGVTSGGFEDRQNINFAVNIAVAQAMYNAWDGTRYTFANHKRTAKMDFTGVYQHPSKTDTEPQANEGKEADSVPESNGQIASSWTCPNCGTVNEDRFCQECGTEKSSWVCVCGKTNNGKFCGSCGRKAEDLVLEFNLVFDHVNKNEFAEAIQALEALGEYDSGSYSTIKRAHSVAKGYIPEVYYEQGLYLVSVQGDHDAILESFKKAGEYGDAKDQIQAENNRYYGAFYNEGVEKAEKGEFEAAIKAFEKAGDYPGAAEKIKATYYLLGMSLLENHKFDASRSAFEKAGGYSDSGTMILRSYYEEGQVLFERGEYQKAIGLFTRADSYPDASNSILSCFYAQGEEALKEGKNDLAKELFEKAGEYKDAKQRVADLINLEKEAKYVEAIDTFDQGNYIQAQKIFEGIRDYKDAEEWIKKAGVYDVKRKYDGIEDKRKEEVYLKVLLDSLDKTYVDFDVAEELRQAICYDLGSISREKDSHLKAISYFEEAKDYKDASSLLSETKTDYLAYLIKEGKYKEANNYLNESLIPDGYNQECIIVQPGDSGEATAYILKLVKVLGFGGNIPKNADTYNDAYIPAVQKLEEYFGMAADGNITLDEYTLVEGSIVLGAQEDRVQQLVEKLYDLSYLKSLAKDHTVYGEGYLNGIKNAEKTLGLTEDGVITPAEYETIMAQKVDLDTPQDVKAKADKDTVTLTWSKVPGAIGYKVYDTFGGLLGETKECKWVQKDIVTGTLKSYNILAFKYTVTTKSKTVTINVPKYYQPVSITEVNGNVEKYLNKNVEITNMTVIDWSVISSTGETFRTYNEFISAGKNNSSWDFVIIGGNSSQTRGVALHFIDYKVRKWNATETLLRHVYNKNISRISVKGRVFDYVTTQEVGNIVRIKVEEVEYTKKKDKVK